MVDYNVQYYDEAKGLQHSQLREHHFFAIAEGTIY